jgi:hypothetical protein
MYFYSRWIISGIAFDKERGILKDFDSDYLTLFNDYVSTTVFI